MATQHHHIQNSVTGNHLTTIIANTWIGRLSATLLQYKLEHQTSKLQLLNGKPKLVPLHQFSNLGVNCSTLRDTKLITSVNFRESD
jgi:hypothetical protein